MDYCEDLYKYIAYCKTTGDHILYSSSDEYMAYCSELCNFVLNSDPLIHILTYLSITDVYNVKCVNRSLNKNSRMLNEIKLRQKFKKNTIERKFKETYIDKAPNTNFLFKLLFHLKQEVLDNTILQYSTVPSIIIGSPADYHYCIFFETPKKQYGWLISNEVHIVIKSNDPTYFYIKYADRNCPVEINFEKRKDKVIQVFSKLNTTNSHEIFKKYFN